MNQSLILINPHVQKQSEEWHFLLEKPHEVWADRLFLFLQNVFHLYPEGRFHHLILEEVGKYQFANNSNATMQTVYQRIQSKLPLIKPFLSELTFALPSLKKQRQEMQKQTVHLLKGQQKFDVYVELATLGRYVKSLNKELKFKKVYTANQVKVGYNSIHMVERASPFLVGQELGFDETIQHQIPQLKQLTNQVNLITCFSGLHHCPIEFLEEYIATIAQSLKQGGFFILREHDVRDEVMNYFVSLIHTIFNLGLNVSWEEDQLEYRAFRSIEQWKNLLQYHGLIMQHNPVFQDNDSSLNALMVFQKV